MTFRLLMVFVAASIAIIFVTMPPGDRYPQIDRYDGPTNAEAASIGLFGFEFDSATGATRFVEARQRAQTGSGGWVRQAFALEEEITAQLAVTNLVFPPPGSTPPGGIFSITATFENIGVETFDNIFFRVETIEYNDGGTPPPELNNADRGGTGVGAEIDAVLPVGGLTPGGTFDITFDILLPRISQFRFVTNAFTGPIDGAPTVTITAPIAASTIIEGSSVPFEATATDDVGVTQVEFFVDGVSIGVDTTSPYATTFVVPASPSPLPLSTIATDTIGQTGSDSISVIIQPDLPPTVTITAPIAASTIIEGSSVPFEATATDDVGVTQVEFFVDGVSIGVDTTSPYATTFVVPASSSPLPLSTIATDTIGQTGSDSISVTIQPSGAPPMAVDDFYDSIGNVGINVPVGPGLLNNDTLNGATITAFDATSANGGTVNVIGDGSFTYTPPAGFTGIGASADTFTYTLTNGGGPDTATVSIDVSEMIWFIDSGAGVAGDGRLSSPFQQLSGPSGNRFDPGASDLAGDNIFLADGSYVGGLTLLNNQRLIGDGLTGTTLDAVIGISLPTYSSVLPPFSGTDPLITSPTNGINLGSGNTIRGLDIGDTTGTGLNGTSVGPLTVSEVVVSGTGGGVDLTSTTTDLIDVSLESLSASSSTDEGIKLSSVRGSFSISATNGTISTTGVPAIDITGEANPNEIALGTMTFTSVAANGGTNGVSLTNTTGSFTVTGDGTTATQGGNDSGGIVQNTTGDGIVLNNATDITLRNMTIGATAATPANGASATANIATDGIDATDVTGLSLFNVTIARTGDHGIRGLRVTNLTLEDSLVLDAGNANEEHGLDLTELRGDNFVTDSLFDAFNETGIELSNASGTVDLTISNTTFQDNQATVGNFGEEAILLEASGSATIVAKITGNPDTNLTNSIFDDIERQSVQAISDGTTSNIQLTVENSRFLEHDVGDAIIIMNPDNAGSGNLTVKDNFFTDDTFGAFAVLAKNDSTGTLDVTVQGNTATNLQLVNINHDGIGSGGLANGTTNVLIGGTVTGQSNTNTVGSDNISVDIIATETPATGSSPDLSLTIQNNTTTQPQNFTFVPGLRVDIQEATRANLNISGNSFQGDPVGSGGSGIEVKEQDTSVVGLQGFAGGTAAAAQTEIDTNNPLSLDGSFVTSHDNSIGSGTAILPTATTQPSP